MSAVRLRAGTLVLAVALGGCAAIKEWIAPAPPPPAPVAAPPPAAPPPPAATRPAPPPAAIPPSPPPPPAAAPPAPAPPGAPGRPAVRPAPVPPPAATPTPAPVPPPPLAIPAPVPAPPPPAAVPAPPPVAVPPPVLAPEVGSVEERRLEREARTRIDGAEKLMRGIDGRRLGTDQRRNFDTVQSFLDKAREALVVKDVQRAYTLADKAYLLADELSRRAR